MRYVSRIQDLWDAGGPFVFGDRPCGRVTVEKSYELRVAESTNGGRHGKSPFRWFQRGDTTEQYETEIPNIKNIDIERDLNSDAATCKVTVMNTKSLLLGEAEEQEGVWGKPGYFTYSRGLSQEAKARWGQSANEWSNVLAPNALLRTYQGYGGHDKTIPEAVADGDLVLTGVWLVDEVNVGANTDLSISCRDMAKLLIEQQLYPPLMPSRLYPLEYFRWKHDTTAIPSGELPAGSDNPVGLTCHYGCDFGGSASSSTDSVYGYNANILGHYPTDAFDSSPSPDSLEHQATFWLSNGHSSPSGFEWIEMCCDGGETNKVYVHPWGGSYECYVSVWENGGWVPPEDSEEGGIVPCLDYSGVNTAEIPYVTKIGIPWEAWDRQAEHSLPRVYRADKIRLTFTNLTASQWEAPNHYRAGVRKMFPMFDRKEAIARGWLSTYACAPFPKVDADAVGYWQVRQNGNVFGFGDARIHDSSASNPTNVHTSWVVAMYGNHDGLGYWTMGMNGQVIAYGSAEHYGDRSVDPGIPGGYTGFAPTPTGLGYWLLRRDGEVFPFGDAADHGSPSYVGSLPTGVDAWAHCIESHPVDSGYWVLWTDGHVDAMGSVTDYGDANRSGFTDTEYVGTLRRTSAGDGYWIVSGGGKIQQFGSAFNYGSATVWPPEDWAQGLVWDFVPNWNTDGGYAFQRANGELDYRGDWEWFGSVADGQAILRKDGNYKDYSDIVKDLVLWSGFHLYDPEDTSTEPVVYGNIESTGAYAKEDLPKDMFDKKPIIDPITQLKEVVGYIVWVDQEGGFRFESPNWWSLGNYDYSGVELDLIPVVDEMTQMLSYNVSASDRDARSEIMISTAEPTEDFSDVLTTRIVPPSAATLKGMVRPAQWFNGMFLNKKEQEVMAELISMHIWFAERMGSVTCWANPLIDINDQVRIYERTSGETFVHYVRGVSTTFDAETNSYQMTLTTNWLGGSPFNRRPLFLSCASKPDGTGYWQARNDGSIYAFGDAELFGTDDTHLNWVVSIRSSSTGEGYYTLDLNGGVIARGDAVHYGELNRGEEDCVDMAVTPTGAGYWILTKDGEVFPFGDANDHGGVTPTGSLPSGEAVVAHSIESHPTDDGYWVLTTDGTVTAAGALSSFGDADRNNFRYTEYVAELRRTVTGDGYWIVSGSGRVQEFGDAVHSGQPPAYPQAEWVDGLVWSFIPNYAGSGYALQHADGNLDFFGTMTNEGEAYTSGAHQQMDWGIGTQGTVDVSVEPSVHYVIADSVVEFLEGLASPSAQRALSTGFGQEDAPSLKAAP